MSEINPTNGRLGSWKEIAAYLNKDVRTAIRYEKERGLPVHHVPGEGRRTIYAFKNEIDAWLNQNKEVEFIPLVVTLLPVAPVEAPPQSIATPKLSNKPSKWFIVASVVVLLFVSIALVSVATRVKAKSPTVASI